MIPLLELRRNMENIILSKNIPMVIGINILKSHLRIAHNHEDEYLEAIIKMATGIVETKLATSIITKEYQLLCYPTAKNTHCKVKLPIRNILSITNVTQNDLPIDYVLNREHNEISFIAKTDNAPITINYKAGISDNVQCISEELKYRILCIAKDIYDCSDEKQVAEHHYVEL